MTQQTFDTAHALNSMRRIGSHLDECLLICARVQSQLPDKDTSCAAYDLDGSFERLWQALDNVNRQLQWTMDEVYNIGDDNLIIL